MQIEIISDVVCPWCYVGKRQIEAALASHARANPGAAPHRIRWKPFELNPTLPEEGMSREEYVRAKFGAARSRDVYSRVTAVGLEHGIAFAFDRIVRQPNTLAAHSLIALADEDTSRDGEDSDGDGDARSADPALQGRLVESLFRAYLVDGADLTDHPTLAAIAADAGMNRARADACLADPAKRRAVRAEEDRARQMGVQGVPFFILDRRLAVSGAQGAEALLEAIGQLEATRAAAD